MDTQTELGESADETTNDIAPPPGPNDIIRKNISRSLAVALSPSELVQRGKSAGERALELDKMREAYKEASKAAKDEIEVKEGELEALFATLRTGSEERLVECYEQFHAGAVLVVRGDNGRIVDSRPANHSERQLVFPEDAGDLVEPDHDDDQDEDDEESDGDDVAVDPDDAPPAKRRSKKRR